MIYLYEYHYAQMRLITGRFIHIFQYLEYNSGKLPVGGVAL